MSLTAIGEPLATREDLRLRPPGFGSTVGLEFETANTRASGQASPGLARRSDPDRMQSMAKTLPVHTTFARRVFGGRGTTCLERRGLGGCGVRRGEIRWYTFRLPDKRRPVLILTRNDVIDRLNEVIVVPAT